MRRMGIYAIGLLFLFSSGLLDTVEARKEGTDDGNKVYASIRHLISLYRVIVTIEQVG